MKNGIPGLFFYFFILAISATVLTGCGSSSNDPIVASSLSEGSGYTIKMLSSVETVPPGGTALISAAVFNPEGKPVGDDEQVFFSSNLEGTFEGLTDGVAKTKNGVATAIFKSPATDSNADKPQASRANRIFASYKGALSYVEITMVSPSF